MNNEFSVTLASNTDLIEFAASSLSPPAGTATLVINIPSTVIKNISPTSVALVKLTTFESVIKEVTLKGTPAVSALITMLAVPPGAVTVTFAEASLFTLSAKITAIWLGVCPANTV